MAIASIGMIAILANMLRRLLLLPCFIIILAACQPQASADLPPTAIPFPTMTPGRAVRGLLPTVSALSLNGAGLANPATAVALANLPTAAPNYNACPTPGTPTLSTTRPNTGREMTAEIVRFLSEGGAVSALETSLRDSWGILNDSTTFRADLDFTGEGTADLLLAYSAPDDGGTLLLIACANGRYQAFYQAITDSSTPPEIVWTGDINFDSLPELVFAGQSCTGENCAYQTQVATWDRSAGRIVSLLSRPISSVELPALSDVDNDRVSELVVRLTDPGSPETGPLRTGVNIYDWNGAAYVLSITQLDAPRFKIQAIHEADRAFARLEMQTAISLYDLALSSADLRYWLNDEPTLLNSYVLFRLVTLYAYIEDDRLLPTYQASVQTYPDPLTAPVYTQMTNAFWNALQVTNNLHSACLEVQAVIQQKPEAVGFLNRYGSRSPTYTAEELCPF